MHPTLYTYITETMLFEVYRHHDIGRKPATNTPVSAAQKALKKATNTSIRATLKAVQLLANFWCSFMTLKNCADIIDIASQRTYQSSFFLSWH